MAELAAAAAMRRMQTSEPENDAKAQKNGAETDGGSQKGEDATAKIVGVNTASDDDDSVPTKSDDTFTYVLCVSRGIDKEKVVNVI